MLRIEGFFFQCNSFEDDNEDKTRYLHIVTAIAKVRCEGD